LVLKGSHEPLATRPAAASTSPNSPKMPPEFFNTSGLAKLPRAVLRAARR
jgi:hypothetical protein